MREILFRGKRIDNGEWVEGSLLKCNRINKGKVYICPDTNVCDVNMDDGGKIIDVGLNFGCWYEVDPETVGQFTGMADKTGRKIFEEDIINFSNPRPFKDFVAEVAFNDGCFDLVNKSRCFRDYLKCYTCNHVGEVIGNRWDNPELLEDVR